jgi:hypothetical protein
MSPYVESDPMNVRRSVPFGRTAAGFGARRASGTAARRSDITAGDT